MVMDLTIRDWMVIIGILLIVAVLIDAWRRVRSEKYSRVKVNLVDEECEDDVEAKEARDNIALLKELPNGGARVVNRDDLLRAQSENRQLKEDLKADDRAKSAAEKKEPLDGLSQSKGSDQEASAPAAPAEKPHTDVESDGLMPGMSAMDQPENLDWLDTIPMEKGDAAVVAAPVNTAPIVAADKPSVEKLARGVDPEVFMLNVEARKATGFRGEDILHILLACDLRFGDMSFFHRHEFEAGRGPIQFSVANMMQPGVFDIDTMADFSTPGLVFFLTLPGPEDMMKAFDYMLETAQAVARNLDGDVRDESRSLVTKQSLEHARNKIVELERRMLTQGEH